MEKPGFEANNYILETDSSFHINHHADKLIYFSYCLSFQLAAKFEPLHVSLFKGVLVHNCLTLLWE